MISTNQLHWASARLLLSYCLTKWYLLHRSQHIVCESLHFLNHSLLRREKTILWRGQNSTYSPLGQLLGRGCVSYCLNQVSWHSSLVYTDALTSSRCQAGETLVRSRRLDAYPTLILQAYCRHRQKRSLLLTLWFCFPNFGFQPRLADVDRSQRCTASLRIRFGGHPWFCHCFCLWPCFHQGKYLQWALQDSLVAQD